MSNLQITPRVPLRLPSAVATFGIGIAGYLGVNLSPYMITALQSALGSDVLTASWIVTATLLATAITGLAIARFCAGPLRRPVARIGLTLSVVGFAAAALLPVPALVVTGLILGGIGAGGAVAASGAALAAFVNPERVAGVSGLANRGVVTVILAIVPLVGLAPISVFGVLALFSLAMLFTSMWLPAAPVPVPAPVAASAAIPGASAGSEASASAAARRVTIAGFGLLVCFAFWAASEDSLWAMAGFMGAEQAGLTAEGLGIALSGATAAGLVGAVLLMIVGERLGRAVPLAVLLGTGGVLKIVEGYVTDPTSFIVIFIAWNAVYAIAFMYFVATASGLDADGRWSGPLFAVYLVGSALTPVIGAALVEVFGFEGFTLVLGVSSFVLAVPAFAIARLSSRIERRADASSARSAETDVPTDTDIDAVAHADTLEAGAAR